MNLFEKIQTIREELRDMNLKPTGKNEFAKYNYFELDDFLPQLNKLMGKHKMTAVASFTNETASLTAINIEAPEERFVITSPFSSANLKGCHEVQCVGAVETYQRRYLYQALFDIGEKDGLDGGFNPQEPKTQQNKEIPQSKQNKPQNANNSVIERTEEDVKMTLEEAQGCYFSKGKWANVPFSEMPEKNLKWIFEESSCSAKTKKAARLVYNHIQEMKKVVTGGSQLEMEPLSQEEQDQLPF